MACPIKIIILFVLNIVLSIYGVVRANKTNPSYVDIQSFDSYPIVMKEEEERVLTFSAVKYYDVDLKIIPVSSIPDHIEFDGNVTNSVENTETNFTLRVKGKFLGRVYFSFFSNRSEIKDEVAYDVSHGAAKPNNFDWYEIPQQFNVTVSRKQSALSHSFTGMVIILVCLANIAMGCKTELSVVKEVLRKPIGPVTGMFSQFVLMPLIALAVIYMLKFDEVNALGFFAMACSPGGAASNMYTYLLAGDVSLSVTMTLCSTLLSLGMIPLWLFTVGVRVIYKTEIEVPFTNILTSLGGLLIPVLIGMLIKWKKPKWAKLITKGIRPLMVVFFVLVFTIGVYSNLYIFTLMRNKPEILLAGALVPYIGFIFGGVTAAITRQSWERIRTIAIETGIQNTGIAIVLLKVSLPPPDNDISIVAPISAAIFTPIPMLTAIIGYEIYKRCYAPRSEELYLDDKNGTEENDGHIEKGGVGLKCCTNQNNVYINLNENNNSQN